MAPTEISVAGMSCDGCEEIVETALEDVGGVESADADQSSDVAVVEGDAATEELATAIEFAGYESAETAGTE